MKFILLAIIALSGFTIIFFPTLGMNGQSDTLSQLIQKDLHVLEKKNLLPKSWANIGSIEVNGAINEINNQQSFLQAGIPLKINGDRHLEIEIIPWNQKDHHGVTVNYHLSDKKTKNTVWEFGRTFDLKPVKSNSGEKN